MEDKLEESFYADPDQLAFMEFDPEKHPSAQIRLLREAIAKALMNSQRELWEMYAYDKMLPAEIALKLKTSKSNISQRLSVIKRKLIQYCQEREYNENSGC